MYKGTSFLWKTQIQTIRYGLNDRIRIREKERSLIDNLLISTLWYDFDARMGPLESFLS